MTGIRQARIALVAIVATAAAAAEWALAQTPMTPGGTPVPAPAETSSWAGGFLLFAVVAVLLAVLITAIQLYDAKRRQEDAAMTLQARLSDALLTEPSLSGSPIMATVYAPLRRRAPVVVEVAGPVASPGIRDRVLRIVSRATAGIGREARIEDRMVLNPMRTRRVA